MQNKITKRVLSLAMSILLIAASAVFTTGCSDNSSTEEVTTTTAAISEEAAETEAGNDGAAAAEENTDAQSEAEEASDVTVVGEGETSFFFNVTDKDGNETKFEVHTDKTTVGEALLDVDLIAGDDSEYGLYVKTVNGITADYDTDGVYWAFYIDGEYASTGVDSTDITEGSVYSFKVE